MSRSLAVDSPRPVWGVFPEGLEPLRANLLGPQNFLGLGGWKECPLQLISKPLGDPGTPLPGPLFAFPRTLSRRLSTSRPLGCTVGWFRGRHFWTTSQAVRGPAGGDSPGSSTRREGVEESVWEGCGVGSQPGPLGGRTHCQLGTHSRAQLRCVLEARDSTPGLAEGRLHVRGPHRKFLEPSCSAQEARPQMLFLRVRPEIQACLGLPPRGPFPNGLGRLPQTLPLSPHLPSLVLGPLHLVGLCEVVWAGGGGSVQPARV